MKLFNQLNGKWAIVVIALFSALEATRASVACAISPEIIARGKQLFEKNWSPQNPSLIGNDGLGPLFNARSCAACHNQGGLGGGGEAKFNAKTISIESAEIRGQDITKNVVRNEIRRFHPGFIDPNAGLNNSLPLSHFGGTPGFQSARNVLLSHFDVKFSESGGPINSAEVRRANSAMINFAFDSGTHQSSIRARMFQRNTPALFGTSLIDQVTSKELLALERAQKKHPEISGRRATLVNGRIGRFGWRGNVPTLLEFCDKACAAELGLKTHRIDQSLDPMKPRYRNPKVDISDSEIRTMTAFVAALPAPARYLPTDQELRLKVFRGEQVFASVGCAVCHQPNIGKAKGIYSDLLLHDMGKNLYDLNPADPYVLRFTPIVGTVRQIESTMVINETTGTAMPMYYGNTTSMDPPPDSNGQIKSVIRRPGLYLFRAISTPERTIQFVDLQILSQQRGQKQIDSPTFVQGSEPQSVDNKDDSQRSRNRIVRTYVDTTTRYKRMHIERTHFTQEWRTPPLWGVRDSAPYMHDGRAETLLEAIMMHGGESEGTRSRFLALPKSDREAVVEFLKSMVAPKGVPQANLAGN